MSPPLLRLIDVVHVSDPPVCFVSPLPQVRSGDVLEMMQLLGAAMGISNLRDMPAYMQGHLYRCPNGHVYLIGECGGAMQRGRCAECGAAIGGGGHMLEATNTSAADIVERMRRVAM